MTSSIPTPPQTLKPQLKKQMSIMLKMGINPQVIASLLEISQFSLHHIRWFASPIIVHQSAWSSALPQWIRQAIYSDRLEQIFTEHETAKIGELATATEVLACIYPASLDAPLHPDWINVYLWAGNEAMTKHNRLGDGRCFWELMGEHTPIKYHSIKADFERLARDIRKHCVTEGKRRGWGKSRKLKPSTSTSSPTPSPDTPTTSIIQLSLL